MPTPDALLKPQPSLHNFIVVMILIAFMFWVMRISQKYSMLQTLNSAIKSYSVRAAAFGRCFVFLSLSLSLSLPLSLPLSLSRFSPRSLFPPVCPFSN